MIVGYGLAIWMALVGAPLPDDTVKYYTKADRQRHGDEIWIRVVPCEEHIPNNFTEHVRVWLANKDRFIDDGQIILSFGYLGGCSWRQPTTGELAAMIKDLTREIQGRKKTQP